MSQSPKIIQSKAFIKEHKLKTMAVKSAGGFRGGLVHVNPINSG